MEKCISLIEKSSFDSEVKNLALYLIDSLNKTNRKAILLCESDWSNFHRTYEKVLILFQEIGLRVRKFKTIVTEYNSVNSDGEGCTEREILIDRYFLQKPITDVVDLTLTQYCNCNSVYQIKTYK
jgi:hypothetical protein